MKTTSFRARSLACALLATTAYCGLTAQPAAAQTARQHRALDANGVDLTHGDFLMRFVEGSIGSGDGELALVRTRIGSGNGLEHASSGGHQWDGIRLEQAPKFGGGSVISVFKDGRFEQFQSFGTLPSGSTLSSNYQYRTADGTVIAFIDPAGHDMGTSTYCNGSSPSCILLPGSITSPDGKTVTIVWDLFSACDTPQEPDTPFHCSFWARIASVSNSHGYRIAFSYASQTGLGGSGGPSNDWARRTGATFHNDLAGGAAVASVSYSYPSTSIVDVTDTGGRVWRFSGDTFKITGIRRPGAASDTTSISYVNGQVTSVVRDGVTTSYARSVSGNSATMTVTNALSQQTSVVSDLTIGRPTLITDALSRTTSFQYDPSGRLTRVTQPEGNYVQYTLDARGNVTQTQAVAKSGSGLATITTSASYDSTCANPLTCNQPNSTTDARGNVTDYTYDATHGGLLTVTAPAPTNGAVRPQTRYGYTLTNGEYQLTSVSACQTLSSCAGAADEVKTTLGYDVNGNVTSVSSGSGNGSLTATSAMTYDALGNLLTVDGPLSGTADTTRYRYNGARELVGTISADPDGAGALKHRAVRNTYTNALLTKVERGTVNSQSDGDWAAFSSLEAVETGYDANARPVTTKLVAGGSTHALTQTSYDALGRPECSAQRMNPAAFGSLPTSACTLGTQGSFGPDRIAKLVYNAAGEVTQQKVAVGTSDEAAEMTSTYRPNGQVETVTDAENNKTTFVYDGHDRLYQTQYPSATKGAGVSNAADYEQLGYDAAGNVTSKRLRDGQVIAFTFDALNRATYKDLPNTATFEWDVSYAYDNLGRLTQASDVNHGMQHSLAYDALGRVTSETSNWYGTRSSAYDVAGRRTRLTWRDGFYVDYDYLVTGEMSAIRENGATSGIGVLATFGYDDLGRRTSLTRGNGTVTGYGYDAASRLASLSQDLAGSANDLSLTFSHSPASQIVSNTRSNDVYAWTGHGNGTSGSTANGLNQLTLQGGTSLSHDARGNVTAIGTSTYAYTAENRMTTMNGVPRLADNPLGQLYYTGEAALFTYDPAGGAGAALIEELTYPAAPSILRRYVHGPGVDEPLVWYEGSGTSDRRFLHADERGSIVAVSDSAGNVIGLNKYDEYGKPQGTLLGRFGYTGQAFLPDVGLYHYKARMYHPSLGRFMQTDPIGYDDGMNLYAYVRNDPVNFTDPSGTRCVWYRGRGRRGSDASGGIVVEAGRMMQYCWDDEDFFRGHEGQVGSEGGGSGDGGSSGEGQPSEPPHSEKDRHPRERTNRPDKGRSQCVALMSGFSAAALSHYNSHTIRVGAGVFRGMLLGGRVGAVAGGGLFSFQGIVIGAAVGGLVYYLDQRLNNAGANALNGSDIAC